MFKNIQKGFNNIGKNIEGAVRGTVVGNAATGGDGWNLGGGGGESTETTTQQNLPDWAMPAAMGTLAIGDYYTMNPTYRPSTLDRDYSGIRGYDQMGQPNSQVGQFGFSPMPEQDAPANDNTATATKSTIDPNDSSNLGNLTPFPAYDRQRFAAPDQNTVRGEGILAGRYDQRFGPGGTDPFADAKTAVDEAANYSSTYTGTTGRDQNGELRIGSQAGNYQTNLANAKNPGVFSGSTDYKTGLDTKFSNPNAGMQNVNAGLRSQQFGNANQGLTPAQNYSRNFQQNLAQFQDPYTNQVVNQTIKDLDRARRITNNDISGGAAKSGAFGGSREALMRAENNRNFADRTAAAVGQLRSQGFQQAADRAQQEQLQRLGLTASDVQNLRGYQSAGNLQGQNISAQDVRDVRGLRSQGALTAQGLQSQGALAALNANANLYGQGLNLGAGMDRAALQANAGLLSDAMSLDAADLQQRRSIASNESQFAETANRGAAALNLQGGQALGDLVQARTADERQSIGDLLASGQAGDARNQQDLDFIYGEFDRELAYPGQQIDLRNAAISPATGSIVTTTQPRYEQNPLLAGLGAGVSTYALTGNPYLAGGAGLLSYMNS